MGGPFQAIPVVIAISTTTSPEVNLGRFRVIAVALPAAMTGASITFTGCDVSGGTFKTVTAQDTPGTDYSLTFTANKHVPIDYRLLWGCRYLKIVSASSEAAARTFSLLCLPLSD